MLSGIKKQHLIIFVLMLSLLFGAGVTYGKYLAQKAPPQVTVSAVAEDDFQDDKKEENESEGNKEGKTGIVVVHVAGAVEQPGVYTLQEGSRIVEAVQMAIPKKDADLNSINLAKKLADQEMIIVPGPGGEGNGPTTQAPAAGSSTVSSVNNSAGGSLININMADQAQLETLPGIGPAKAGAIIQYREEKGGFSSVEDIQNVSGIGPATFNKLKDLITI